jgi:hypothetical protein
MDARGADLGTDRPPVDAGDGGDRRDAPDGEPEVPADRAPALDGPTPSDRAGGGSGPMTVFVTSVGLGRGGNLGGLEGADQHCRTLAAGAGARRTRWAAYLSTSRGPVHARDRIGPGPWHNARGELVARTVEDLHPDIDPAANRAQYLAARPAAALFMDERGQPVPPNERDVLTGSQADGRLFPSRTCGDWRSQGEHGSTNVAQVGHAVVGEGDNPSWNSAHETKGCSTDPKGGVASGGGSGRFYCFAPGE